MTCTSIYWKDNPTKSKIVHDAKGCHRPKDELHDLGPGFFGCFGILATTGAIWYNTGILTLTLSDVNVPHWPPGTDPHFARLASKVKQRKLDWHAFHRQGV